MSKDLTSFPGKEGLMITVEYPPGSKDPIHRHNAYGFIYVLEGSIVMQVKGGRETTLTPGQTFYEGPDDVHVVGRNASQTKPAKFVVFFVKDKGRSNTGVRQIKNHFFPLRQVAFAGLPRLRSNLAHAITKSFLSGYRAVIWIAIGPELGCYHRVGTH